MVDRVSKTALVLGALALVAVLLRLKGDQRDTGEIISAVLVLVGTLGTVWASSAKEHQANRDIADARAIASDAAIALDRERLERQSLEEKVSSRRLKPKQRELLIAELRKRLPLAVTVELISDQEAHIYGRNIVEAMLEAGVQVEVEINLTMLPMPNGLEVHGVGVRPFAQAFMASDISFALGLGAEPSPIITVGLKPPAT